MSTGTTSHENQIKFCILEKFPDLNEEYIIPEEIQESIRKVIPGLLVRKPDTIIKGPNGTLIRFSGESFDPYKLSDFQYKIDEMFTTEAIGNNNMSTMTSGGALINSFKAIRIWATPR